MFSCNTWGRSTDPIRQMSRTFGWAHVCFRVRIRPGGHCCGSFMPKAHADKAFQHLVLSSCYLLLRLQTIIHHLSVDAVVSCLSCAEDSEYVMMGAWPGEVRAEMVTDVHLNMKYGGLSTEMASKASKCKDEAHHSEERTGGPAGRAPHHGMAAFSARGAAARCIVAERAERPRLHCCACLEAPDSHASPPDPRAFPAATTIRLQRVLSRLVRYLSFIHTSRQAWLTYKASSRARHDPLAQCRSFASVASHRLEVSSQMGAIDPSARPRKLAHAHLQGWHGGGSVLCPITLLFYIHSCCNVP